MHFHLPKPLHGWREFAGEVGIIVIGVLIALCAEQVVEEIHFRNAVASERTALHEALRAELAEPAGRLTQEPCIRRRLDELLIVFRRHKNGAPLGTVGSVGVPGVVGSSTDAWRTESGGGGTLDHMNRDERLELGNDFAALADMRSGLVDEARVWDELGPLDHPEILEADDWPQLRAAYSDALAWDDRNVFLARWLLKHNTEGEKPGGPTLQELKTKGSVRALCEPLLAR
jgi:hypothetical protein